MSYFEPRFLDCFLIARCIVLAALFVYLLVSLNGNTIYLYIIWEEDYLERHYI